MQILVNLPESAFEMLKTYQFILSQRSGKTLINNILNAVKAGTPLPEPHGKIGDIDALHEIFDKACDNYSIDNLSFISEVNMNFDLAPTIIPSTEDKCCENCKNFYMTEDAPHRRCKVSTWSKEEGCTACVDYDHWEQNETATKAKSCLGCLYYPNTTACESCEGYSNYYDGYATKEGDGE